MLTSPDFKELLSLFKKYNVKYLVVGGHAIMKYSEPSNYTRWRHLFEGEHKVRPYTNC
jgi:RNase H-fold protein (predicted Holliday junction resolvase)